MCVWLRPARRTAERSQISRKGEESWAWEGAAGPGPLLKGAAALLALPARPAVWPPAPQLGGHRGRWSLRAALGSWKPPAGWRASIGPVFARRLQRLPCPWSPASERHSCGRRRQTPCVSGGLALLARGSLLACGSLGRCGRTQCRMLLGTCLPAKLAAGQEPDRDAGVPLTRGATGAGEDSTEACHSAGHLGPRSWLWRWGRKGPRWAEAAWPRRQGAPVCSVPGKGEVLGPPARGTGPQESDGPLLPAWGPCLRCLPGDSSASARAELCVSDLGPVVCPDR